MSKNENKRSRSPENGEKKIEKSKSTYKLGRVTMLKFIKSVNDLFNKAVDYCTYRVIKQLESYDDVTHKCHHMVKKMAVQMTGKTFSGTDSYL